jgi:glycine/D-amino acid oxidase-like deaminating enzyme
VVVVGLGVIGLGTAVCLAEAELRVGCLWRRLGPGDDMRSH